MTEDNTPARHPFEPRPADIAAARRPSGDLERFLGGSPASVFVRLLFLSLIVGFFLVWLDIRPIDVLIGLRNMVSASGTQASTRFAICRICRGGRGHCRADLAGASPPEHAAEELNGRFPIWT